jgi:5-formyltetrahydrofolate cyclo-ligase
LPQPSPQSRPALRRALLAGRAALSPAARAAAQRRILDHVARLPALRPGATVGLYVSRGSEVATEAIRALARSRGCRVFLPLITDHENMQMEFHADHGRPLRQNRYRIGEPIGGRSIAAPALAVVLMPLVGMDDFGNRLGNGAGYYDRWLAFRRGTHGTPLLVGLAFECQRHTRIEPQAHDVPLDAVITENGLQVFAPRH